MRRNVALNVSEIGKTLDYVRNLKVGSHGIFFYRNSHEKHEVLFNFLQAGLDKEEGAIYVASQETSKQIRRRMENFGFNVKSLERDGVLRILDYDHYYIIDGQVNPANTMKLVQNVFNEAIATGLKGLRGCGEAACFFEHRKQEELMEWELMIGRKLDLPITALCAYDAKHAKSLKEKRLFSLIKAHGPVLTSRFVQELAFENLFPTIMEQTLETVFGDIGKELILIMLDKHHSLTSGERERRIAQDPMSFFEGLEEVVGSGAVVVEKSMAKEMLCKIGMM